MTISGRSAVTERAGDLSSAAGRERARRDRLPLRASMVTRGTSLSSTSRAAVTYTGPRGFAVRELQRAMHDLLGVRADADFVLVTDVAAHQAALVRHVLDPLDEFVAAAARLAFLRGRRHSGDDEHRHASLRRVVNRAAERLRAAVDVHEHRLRATRGLRIAMRGRHRDHFRRTGDDLRTRLVRRARLRDRLDQSGVIAAEIREQIFDAAFDQRIENCRTRRIHSTHSSGRAGHRLHPERTSWRAESTTSPGTPRSPPRWPRDPGPVPRAPTIRPR